MESAEVIAGKAHTPDPKALRKHSLSRLLSSLWQAASWISFIWLGFIFGYKRSVENTYEWATIALSVFLALTALLRFFISIYQMRRSMLYTCPGHVIYIKRVWRPCSAVRYIAYRIDHIRDHHGSENTISSLVKGKIQTVNLDEAGQALSTPRVCRKVKIPPVYADKEKIYTAFNEIQSATDRAEGRALLSWLQD